MKKTDMWTEVTASSKEVNIQKRIIKSVSVNDHFFDSAEEFIGKVVYPKNIHKWDDGTYGFDCVIGGIEIYFHSVVLDKHIK